MSEACLKDKQAGLPIVVWRNGRIEWIPPKELDQLVEEHVRARIGVS
ncbi:MAG: hypothetical protein JXQ73_02395 [Phycisphaerae bacterium]|nr:hypothetical protein [Phycisphaerae bacterium]